MLSREISAVWVPEIGSASPIAGSVNTKEKAASVGGGLVGIIVVQAIVAKFAQPVLLGIGATVENLKILNSAPLQAK